MTDDDATVDDAVQRIRSTQLVAFISESNRIEGIHRDPTEAEITATAAFLALPELKIADVVDLVAVYQPNAVLRDRPGLNVQVGNYIAPPGGGDIVETLDTLLNEINRDAINPWSAHVVYETLHPFTDGNGRSGRAIWLWQHRGNAPLGFLHQFYYQTLERTR